LENNVYAKLDILIMERIIALSVIQLVIPVTDKQNLTVYRVMIF
jgi:hypothetical protein